MGGFWDGRDPKTFGPPLEQEEVHGSGPSVTRSSGLVGFCGDDRVSRRNSSRGGSFTVDVPLTTKTVV